MTPAEIRLAGQALAKRTRAAQVLPRTIRDRDSVRHVVALLVDRGRAKTDLSEAS